MQPKAGAILHLRLNTGMRPIANKYREEKLESTLKREFKSTFKVTGMGVSPLLLRLRGQRPGALSAGRAP